MGTETSASGTHPRTLARTIVANFGACLVGSHLHGEGEAFDVWADRLMEQLERQAVAIFASENARWPR